LDKAKKVADVQILDEKLKPVGSVWERLTAGGRCEETKGEKKPSNKKNP